MTSDDITVRLDLWLWAARFYRTRSLAKQAIDTGKVDVGGQRAKASRTVRLVFRQSPRLTRVVRRLVFFFSPRLQHVLIHSTLLQKRLPKSNAST